MTGRRAEAVVFVAGEEVFFRVGGTCTGVIGKVTGESAVAVVSVSCAELLPLVIITLVPSNTVSGVVFWFKVG